MVLYIINRYYAKHRNTNTSTHSRLHCILDEFPWLSNLFAIAEGVHNLKLSTIANIIIRFKF